MKDIILDIKDYIIYRTLEGTILLKPRCQGEAVVSSSVDINSNYYIRQSKDRIWRASVKLAKDIYNGIIKANIIQSDLPETKLYRGLKKSHIRYFPRVKIRI